MKIWIGIAVTASIAVAMVLPGPLQSTASLKLRVADSDAILADYGEAKLEGEIRNFCTQCHGFPEPDLYSASRWPAEIDRAYRFHEQYGDPNLFKPDSRLALAWFKKNTHTNLDIAKGEGLTDTTVFGPPSPSPTLKTRSGTSSMLVRKDANRKTLITTDMLSGRVRAFHADTGYETVFRAANPARIRTCDLSDKYVEEYLIADLGTPGVTDELCGKVVWLRKSGDTGEFESVTICDQLGRVADARSADFDGDGDEDVVIAEFGWNETGSVVLLENEGGTFKRSVIDGRHGCVEIEIADMDGDGLKDFVAIFGQELESVQIFRNVGELSFEPRELFAADTPSFGMCSVTLTDADSDGDLDIMVTSGDMYDGFHFQETHGLYLLTNNNGEFEARCIGKQSAVLSATAGDVDGDGDIDFVGGSFVPQQSSFALSNAYPAIVLHEQTKPGVWEPRVLKCGDCCHAAIELNDIDDDGDLDLIVGNLHDVQGKPEPTVTVWHTQTRDP